MSQGTVKFFNQTKGFGFIKDDESETEIFVHATGLLGQIRDNERVEFKIVKDKRGDKAIEVKKI